MMNILLHGATNSNSTNFGDFIYANELARIVKENGANVSFYSSSDFFSKYCNYIDNNISSNNYDKLIYIPGGYFSESTDVSLKDSIYRFLRYMPIGIKSVFKKKDVCIIGIGAGPINSFIMKKSISFICNHSKIITVRDKESKEALLNISRKKKIHNFGDMIVSFPLFDQAIETNQIVEIKKLAANKKRVMLIHYNHSDDALQLFAETIKTIASDDDLIIVASDSVLSDEDEKFAKFCNIYNGNIFHFIYNNPYEMLNLISISDVVFTCKLHVGVVASMYSKSVICTAINYPKTHRFYNQIMESRRCIPLSKANTELLSNMFEEFKDKPIRIPSEYIEASKEHRKNVEIFIKGDY